MNHENSYLPLNIPMLCRSASYQGMGGPVWSIRALLKEQDSHPEDGISLSAVLYDGIFRKSSGFADLRMKSSHKSFLPGSLEYVFQAVASVPRMLNNINTEVKHNKGYFVLHCHDFITAYLCRRRFGQRYPLLLTIHAKGGGRREVLMDYPILRRTPISILTKHIEDTATRQADIVAFPSGGARDLFIQEHPGLLCDKDVRVVHAGIDVDELLKDADNPSILEKYSIPSGKHLIISIAAMVQDKGLDTLIEAIGQLPEGIKSYCFCLIVGREGPLKDQVKRLILEYQLQDIVRLVGFLPRMDMVQLVHQATLFVLPSRVAVFDVVLLEAAALGTAIITSAIGGNLEMFDSESALFVQPGDPQELANALIKAISYEELRNITSEKALERVRTRFSIRALFNSYVGIYKELAGSISSSKT